MPLAVAFTPGGAWRSRRGGDEVNTVPMGKSGDEAGGLLPFVGVSRSNEDWVGSEALVAANEIPRALVAKCVVGRGCCSLSTCTWSWTSM